MEQDRKCETALHLDKHEKVLGAIALLFSLPYYVRYYTPLYLPHYSLLYYPVYYVELTNAITDSGLYCVLAPPQRWCSEVPAGLCGPQLATG